MSKPLAEDDKRRKYLLAIGQTVFLEGKSGSARNPLKPMVKVSYYEDESIVNKFMESHGHILVNEDLDALPLKEKKKSSELQRGTHGNVISHFWTEISYKEKNDKGEEEDKMHADTFCMLLIGDKVVIIPFDMVNIVYGK